MCLSASPLDAPLSTLSLCVRSLLGRADKSPELGVQGRHPVGGIRVLYGHRGGGRIDHRLEGRHLRLQTLDLHF